MDLSLTTRGVERTGFRNPVTGGAGATDLWSRHGAPGKFAMHRTAMDAHTKREAHTDAILQQVARVLNHRSFARSRCPARILRALSERLLVDGRRPITQMDLARVLELPRDFDPARNPLVRIHMGKLRRMLARYTEGDGRRDPVTLVIPRNVYRLEGFINGVDAESPAQGNGALSKPRARDNGQAVVLVSEFVPAEESLRTLTRYLALWLMPQVLDIEGFAAVGPILWERGGVNAGMRDGVAHNYGCDFIAEGDCRHGGRGIEIVIRIVDVHDGSVRWTDWLDEPAVVAAGGHELVAQMIAARVANAIRRHWNSNRGLRTADHSGGVGQLAGVG